MDGIQEPPLYHPDDHIHEKKPILLSWAYPNFGLYLNPEITPQELVKKPLKQQIKYADAIIRRYAKNKVFLRSKVNKEIEIRKENINATTIGNLAFIYYHNPRNPYIRSHYYETIRLLKS